MNSPSGNTEEPPPTEFWFEEVLRGNTEVLVVMHGAEARGSIECQTYAEKAAWTEALALVNSAWKRLSQE